MNTISSVNSKLVSASQSLTNFFQDKASRYSVYLPTKDSFYSAQKEIKHKAHVACKNTTDFIKNNQLAFVALGSLTAGVVLHSLLRQPLTIPCDADMNKICEVPVETAIQSKIVELVNLQTSKESLLQELESIKTTYASILAKVSELESASAEKDGKINELLLDKEAYTQALKNVNNKRKICQTNLCELARWSEGVGNAVNAKNMADYQDANCPNQTSLRAAAKAKAMETLVAESKFS